MTNIPDPDEALASIQAAREGVGQGLDYPLGYDVASGLLFAVMVAGLGLPSQWSILAVPVVLIGVWLSVRWWKARFGWWISGYSPRRARWVAIGTAVVILGLAFGSLYGREHGPWWLCLVMAGLAWITAVVSNRLWMRVWRAELKEQA